MDVKLGADWDQVEWELGFKGEKIEVENANPEVKLVAQLAEVDFDFVVSYQHLMWLPISDIYFKDSKICMIQLSSYPEYNQMICGDIGTIEGLSFWDGSEKVIEVYGGSQAQDSGVKSYYTYQKKGLLVEMTNDEARAMFIFQPQME